MQRKLISLKGVLGLRVLHSLNSETSFLSSSSILGLDVTYLNMYTIRSSWVGPLAATSNDSGDKKTRIRRSKEERKAMAESFIKKYQSLNEGNFPSLNLAHKEVGGSFYTVREIVREIIQENKVLGPARYGNDVKIGDYPLGSISREPRDILHGSDDCEKEEIVKQTLDVQDLHSFQWSSDHRSGEIGKDSDEVRVGSEELSLNSKEQCCNENESDDANSVNDNHIIGLSEENSEADGKLGSIAAYNAKLTLPTKDVEVETFPLRPATKETDETGTASIDLGNLNGSLNDSETNHAVSSYGSVVLDQITSTDGPSEVVAKKGADGFALSNLDGDSGAITQDAVASSMLNHNGEVNLRSKSSEIPDSLTIKKDAPFLARYHMNQVASNSDLTIKKAEQSKELDGLQSMIAQGTTQGENSSKTSSKNVSKEPIPIAANGYDNTSIGDQSRKGTSPTLDRINLESWSGTSKQGTNPFLALIKAFKDAFVKFWSD